MLVSRPAKTAPPAAASGAAEHGPDVVELGEPVATTAEPVISLVERDFLARPVRDPPLTCGDRFRELAGGCDAPALMKAVEALQRENGLVRPAHLGHALDAGEDVPVEAQARVSLYNVLDAVVTRWWKPVAPRVARLRQELLALAAGGEHLPIGQLRLGMHQVLVGVSSFLTDAEQTVYEAHRAASPLARSQTLDTFSISRHVEVGIDTALCANWNALAYLQDSLQTYLDSGAQLPSTDAAGLVRQPFLDEGFNLVRYSATLQLSQAMHFLNALGLQRESVDPRIHNPFQLELRHGALHLALKPQVASSLVRFHGEMVDRLELSGRKVRLGCPALRAPTPGQGHAVGTLCDFVKEVGAAHALEPAARAHLAARGA